MPHSYGASFAEVGRLGPSSFDAANEPPANSTTSTIIARIGRYCATGASSSLGRLRSAPPAVRPGLRFVSSRSLRAQAIRGHYPGLRLGRDRDELLHHLVG